VLEPSVLVSANSGPCPSLRVPVGTVATAGYGACFPDSLTFGPPVLFTYDLFRLWFLSPHVLCGVTHFQRHELGPRHLAVPIR
jgi:hypothetical protein